MIMSRHKQKSAVRRITQATARVEAQPYRFGPQRRQPRLGGGGAIIAYVAYPTASIASATGTPPSVVMSSITGQTVYKILDGNLSVVSTTATITNVMTVASAASKATIVLPTGDGQGSYLAISQSC